MIATSSYPHFLRGIDHWCRDFVAKLNEPAVEIPDRELASDNPARWSAFRFRGLNAV